MKSIYDFKVKDAKGEDFDKAFDAYIKPYFIKGVPAIFTEVEELYF